MNFKPIFRQKLSINFYISSVLFLICVGLDFYITNVASGGNFTEEANLFGRLWWQLAGSLRFIEIPIWAIVVLGMGYLINYKSEFLALVWLNFLAFNHFLGFLTWVPGVQLNFLYSIAKADWALGYAMSLFSIPAALVVALLQTKLK